MADFDVATTKAWLKQSGFLDNVDRKHFNRCLEGVTANLDALDKVLGPFLENRQLDELGQVECAILRAATFELRFLDVPFRVVINEWVEIAKNYGAENSYRYINGVLDRIARSHESASRSDERIRTH